MEKLIATLAASALALWLGTVAYAAEETANQEPTAQEGQSDPTQREQQYRAALKKCEPLSSADKQKCIEAAKRKHGQM